MPKVSLRVRCPTPRCGSLLTDVVEVAGPDLTAERMTDGDVLEVHYLFCDGCTDGCEVETISSFTGVSATLLGSGQDVEVEIVHEEYDDYLADYEPVDDVLALYREASTGLSYLLQEHGDHAFSALNRMVFSQLIAVMEAYLCDRLLGLVREHSAVRDRVVSNAGIFREVTVTLAAAVVDPLAAQRMFHSQIQRVLYHDLAKVSKLYAIAIQGPIFPSKDVEDILMTAILHRHDCVHRNGRDLEGKVRAFDAPHIEKVRAAIDEMVELIERNVTTAIGRLQNGQP